MANVLNFNKVKKTYFTVTLADDTTIMIGPPTKDIMEEFINLQLGTSDMENPENMKDSTDLMYKTCAKLMSCNKQGKVITEEYVERMLDIEDLITFYSAYMDYISSVVNTKN